MEPWRCQFVPGDCRCNDFRHLQEICVSLGELDAENKHFNTNSVRSFRLVLQVLDSTLREGELFRLYPSDVRVRVASRLADSGLKRVELTVDYPPRTSFREVVPVVNALRDRGVKVVMHGRACEEDIEAIRRYKADGCALYIAVSRLHREYKLHGISEDEVIERLCNAVRVARESGFGYIRATLEDSSRIYLEDGEEGLAKIASSIQRLKESGATIVSLPDTSGLLTPRLTRDFFMRASASASLPLAAHFHNDYGLATANTIEAALEGAEEVHATLLGIGDRNGIADMYELVATLEDIHGVRTGLNRSSLRELYEYFSRVTGIEIPWRHPLSREARTVRAGVHQSMTVKRKEGYIPSRKLENDFSEPLYAITPYISHNLVQTIITPHTGAIDKEKTIRIAESLATVTRDGATQPSLDAVQEIIMNETGVMIPRRELAHYFGGERVYILLKLHPQFPAERLVKEAMEWDGVEGVDEVYGDADMVIRAHINYGKGNVVSLLRQKFPDALQDLKVLVTD